MAEPSMYCTEADVYSHGLPRGSVSNRGQLAQKADTVSGRIFKGVHGLTDGLAVQFRAEAGGSLPSPLVEGTLYYVVESLDDSFRVAASSGGTAITLTTAGARFVFWTALAWSDWIRWASAIVEDSLPAHVVPLVAPYPAIIVATTAELTAWKARSVTGSATESLTAMIDAAQKRLAKWAKGVPLRGANVPEDKRTNKAVTATASASDSRGWRRFGGIY